MDLQCSHTENTETLDLNCTSAPQDGQIAFKGLIEASPFFAPLRLGAKMLLPLVS